MRHLDADMLLLIAEGKVAPRMLLQLMYDHLRELCPECRTNLEALGAENGLSLVGDETAGDEESLSQAADLFREPDLFQQPALAADDSPYTRAFEGAVLKARFTADQMEDERRQAGEDLAELLALAPDHWEERIQGARDRFSSRSLVELMLEKANGLARRDPGAAARLAEMSVFVLHRVPGSAGQTWSEELYARALARKGNALRIGGDLATADATFRELHAFLRDNALDLSDLHPEVASQEASLRHGQGRTEEALERIELAIRLAKIVGEVPLLGGYLVARAEYLRGADRLEEAGEDLEAAVQILDPESDAHLFACAVGTQCLVYCEAGKSEDAATLFAQYSEFLENHDEVWVRIHSTCLRGAVAQSLGDLASAECYFTEARDLFVQNRQIFNASSVALDLAEIYLEQGRSQDLKEIASWLGVLFESTPQHQRAAVALMLFQQATIAEQVTREAIHGLRRTFERSRIEANRSTFQPS